LTPQDPEPKVSRDFEYSNITGLIVPAQNPPSAANPELEVADTVGRLMEFWGFKRPMGRIWALLYLTPEPLGAAEIGEPLRMSSGAVSMALSELVKWGAVKKTWRPGERRDFYEAETSIGKLVQRVLRERELTLVQKFAETLQTAEAELATSAGDVDVSFKRARLRELESLAKLGESLLTALVSGKAVDPSPLLKMAERR
jgi:HTH-type transcriptional regulator, glycine betaine synthesis regulator